ncbi:C-type lectin protein [Pelagophyceae sp. CCMP2097]|nr:C-type lectin protein [Pelagophyceae sp. CCMP2097]
MDKRPSSLSRDGAKAARRMRLRTFLIDPTAVTNEQFKRFVRDSRFKTEAENFKWSFVLEILASNETIDATDAADGLGRVQQSPWWLGVVGANWRKPEGPDSSVRGRMTHPAVHISWNDATAYCKWAERRLPTEAEWEMAARGGLDDEPFPWGAADWDFPKRLNSWEGDFPKQNSKHDGFIGTAPADAYSPNAFGMYNMIGNVWEWTDGGEAEKRPIRGALRVVGSPLPDAFPESFPTSRAGGSYVDTVDGRYNHALRVSTRMDQTPDSGSANTGPSRAPTLYLSDVVDTIAYTLGFRCASDAPKGADEL